MFVGGGAAVAIVLVVVIVCWIQTPDMFENEIYSNTHQTEHIFYFQNY